MFNNSILSFRTNSEVKNNWIEFPKMVRMISRHSLLMKEKKGVFPSES